jgi:hypothetical protein
MNRKETIPTSVIVSDITNIILTIFYTFIWIVIVAGLSCLITPIPATIICGIAILKVRNRTKWFV